MKWILLGTSIALASYGYTQNEEDALRYSQETIGGTARNMSMAGAMTAMGGDYSSTLKNPAASGRFSKNNFSLTSFVENNTSNASFEGNNRSITQNNFKLGNLSYLKVYNLNPNKFNGWVGVQLGAGYNRKQSFNDNFSYFGESDGSIVDYYIAEAGNSSPQFIKDNHPYSSGLAYENYVIDPYFANEDSSEYFYNSGAVGKSMHSRTVSTEGGMGEINLSLSGNYKNKLLIGGSFNIVTLNYRTNFSHIESFANELSWIEEIRNIGSLDVNGTGVNARIGLIYIPVEFIRLGASIETPTRLSIREESNNIITNETSTDYFDFTLLGPNISEFIVRTPLRTNFSLGLVHKKLGSFGAEVELVDYSSLRMKSAPGIPAQVFYSYENENEQIDNLYRSTINIKLGAEARINKQLYLRGGYALFGSAFKPEKGVVSSAIANYTGGIGYNFGEVYLDFATVFTKQAFEHYAYLPEIAGSTSSVTSDNKQFVLTFGYRF